MIAIRKAAERGRSDLGWLDSRHTFSFGEYYDGPWTLVAATFAIGIGSALHAPAWQASVPELVPREDLGAAVALGSVGVNLARAVGPALGGLIVAASSPAAAFLLNAASFAGVIVVLHRWERPRRETVLPAERLWGAVRAGLRYVRHAPELQAVLVRTAAFGAFASAVWALLPLVARRELGLGPLGYGALLGCLGAGAVGGAAVLPRVRRRLSPDALVGLATLAIAGLLVALALVRDVRALGACMAAGGVAWIAVLSTLGIAAQTALPGWVRARGLSAQLLVFMGSLAGGSLAFGALAGRFGVPAALEAAAVGLVLGLATALHWRLGAAIGPGGGPAFDFTPSLHLPAPPPLPDAARDAGPVLITVEYRVAPERAAEFAALMRELSRVRRRDGAIRWDLFQDAADAERHVEVFLCESWLEHLRQHERVTVADRELEERVRALHVGPEEPRVSHLLPG